LADRRLAAIRAAGGVVWRGRRGGVDVALVHRPRYDDWSLPKGKLDAGESELAAAVREVGEEIGSRVAVSRRITTIAYDVAGTRKSVAYWVMHHLDGRFEPNHEVDAVEWMSPTAARARMTYDIERRVVDDFAAVPLPESVIVLVRHAKAGKRSEWRGADNLRPLEATGHAQAHRLIGFLTPFAPDQVITASPLRCVDTVAPVADALGLALVVDPVFDDEAYSAAPGPTETALLALAKPGRVTVVCSQGHTIPNLVDRLARGIHPSDTRKAAAWVLSVVDGTIVTADYYEDAGREPSG
jgi:8-oxo-dGTP pyrophosphatase MutT (NUDIX family)/phosphohistidine phosphatase SixA